MDHCQRRRRVKRVLARQQLVEQDAEREDVAGRRDGLTACLLWGQIPERAQHKPRAGLGTHGGIAGMFGQVQAQPGKGRAVIKGEIDGPNLKGAVLEAIKEEMTAAESQEADPLTTQRLPRSHREHAEEYFNALRDK